ncbi:MAG TPA: Sec-independent protein translocase protein TatB [Caulobacterales bacterium]|nr:Sec-independent protein translocase protein TatB [Caulobacterales bacterium]
MLPSLGFQEIVLLGILALVVVGPKELPLLLRKIGRWTAKLRAMAQEFRTGFDELARQAELDELKKEVEALRRNQVFTDISNEVHRPLDAPPPTLPPHDVEHGAPAVEAETSAPADEAAALPSGDGDPVAETAQPAPPARTAQHASTRAGESPSVEEERGAVARTAP